MSGGLAVTGQKTSGGAGRSAATTRPAFFARRAWPCRPGGRRPLTRNGSQTPPSQKRRMGGSEAETFPQSRSKKPHPQEREHSDAAGGTRDRVRPRDRLKGQPQERQHSAAVFGGTRDRLPPCEGRIIPASGMEARRAETLRGSVYDSPARQGTLDFLRCLVIYLKFGSPSRRQT